MFGDAAYYMGLSKNQGAKDRPQYIMVLILGTAHKGPLILGNSHLDIPDIAGHELGACSTLLFVGFRSKDGSSHLGTRPSDHALAH